MKVLIACEFSGVVRDAFTRRGHDAWSCDILPAEGKHRQCDVLTILDEGWDLMVAHPPCTYIAVSGNRHYAGTKKREDGLAFVRELMNAPIDKWCIENPVSVISSQIRKPDQIIHPYMFGDPVEKKTCLWLKGLPELTPTNVVDVPPPVVLSSGKRMSQWYYDTSCGTHSERGKVRSITFLGFAEAMAEQWTQKSPELGGRKGEGETPSRG